VLFAEAPQRLVEAIVLRHTRTDVKQLPFFVGPRQTLSPSIQEFEDACSDEGAYDDTDEGSEGDRCALQHGGGYNGGGGDTAKSSLPAEHPNAEHIAISLELNANDRPNVGKARLWIRDACATTDRRCAGP